MQIVKIILYVVTFIFKRFKKKEAKPTLGFNASGKVTLRLRYVLLTIFGVGAFIAISVTGFALANKAKYNKALREMKADYERREKELIEKLAEKNNGCSAENN